jgi:hypothetical protein
MSEVKGKTGDAEGRVAPFKSNAKRNRKSDVSRKLHAVG